VSHSASSLSDRIAIAAASDDRLAIRHYLPGADLKLLFMVLLL
jgi:hypothetical protein